MKLNFTPVALLCLAAPVLAAPQSPSGLPYQPPPGWQVTTYPGLKYKVSYTKPTNGFATNINITDENAPGTISEYARRNLVTMRRGLPGFQMLDQAPFVTSAGLHGVKIRAQTTTGGRALRQTCYLFPGRAAQKFVVTLSAPAQDAGKYDGAVDKAMKTFTVR